MFITQQGSHVHYTAGKDRPITINAKDPIPTHIVKNALKTLEMSHDDFWEIYDTC